MYHNNTSKMVNSIKSHLIEEKKAPAKEKPMSHQLGGAFKIPKKASEGIWNRAAEIVKNYYDYPEDSKEFKALTAGIAMRMMRRGKKK